MQASKETLASAILPDTTIRSYQGLVDGLIDPETRSKNLLLLKNNKDNIPNLVIKLFRKKHPLLQYKLLFFYLLFYF